ncbi:MAG: Protein cbp3, mitochondrial [Chrysothrix sp. TS-e1954]|nr:MAG: Protein cbp3, mitochondrial [Chrysothrix sp. TS-e1954]
MSVTSRPYLRTIGSIARSTQHQTEAAQSNYVQRLPRRSDWEHSRPLVFPTRRRRLHDSAPRKASTPEENADKWGMPIYKTKEAISAYNAPSAKERDRDSRQHRAGTVGDSEHNKAIAATETLFKECARQADYFIPQAFEKGVEIPKTADATDIGQGTGWWYENLGLEPNFNTWAQVTFLHMYLLTVRMRYFSEGYANVWMQHLHDHFFWEAEHRMTIFHKINSRTLRNTYLKDLYNQWRGVQGAYDEGLVKGDAVLATAVWRNVFTAKADVDWKYVALVVGFMRRGVRALDKAGDRAIVGSMVRFGSPMSEMPLVLKPSRGLHEPFNEEDEIAAAKEGKW